MGIMKIDFVERDGTVFIGTGGLFSNWGCKDSLMGFLNPNKITSGPFLGWHKTLKKRGKPTVLTFEEFEKFLQNYNPILSKRFDYEHFKAFAREYINTHKKSVKSVSTSEGLESTTEISKFLSLTESAKMLRIGVKKDWVPFLLSSKAIYRAGSGSLLPYEKEISLGRFITSIVDTRNGKYKVPQTLLTQNGFRYWSKKYEIFKEKEKLTPAQKFIIEKGLISDWFIEKDYTFLGVNRERISVCQLLEDFKNL